MLATVEDMLKCGMIVKSKLPDIYWSFDLSGAEMRVLRYIFETCMYEYSQGGTILATAKRGLGEYSSPRVLKSKDELARLCNMSPTGLRNTLKSLCNKGLVTSMKPEDVSIITQSQHHDVKNKTVNREFISMDSIGLSTKFLENLELFSKKEMNSLTNMANLLRLLYRRTAVDLIDDNLLSRITITPLKVLCQYWDIKLIKSFSEKETTNQGFDEAISKKITTLEEIQRIPCQKYVLKPELNSDKKPVCEKPVCEKPVNEKSLRVIKRAKEAQEEILDSAGFRDARDCAVFEMADYYNLLAKKAMHTTGFQCVSRQAGFRRSLSWRFLNRIYDLCEKNGFDYKIYLDAQFERVKYWRNSQVRPYLNQCFSENAVKSYHNYMKDYKGKYSITGDIKVKPKVKVKKIKKSEGKSLLYLEALETFQKDCKKIELGIQLDKKKKIFKDAGLTDLDFTHEYIIEHWLTLSAEYLSTIPWILKYLETYPKNKYVTELIDDIQRYQKSNKISTLLKNALREVETSMNLPSVDPYLLGKENAM